MAAAGIVRTAAMALGILASSAAGLGCLGCDQGHQDDQPIVNSAAPITPTLVSTDDPVVIQFNRFLNPGTVNRQTIQLLTAGGTPVNDPVVEYDPVLLRVTLTNPHNGGNWLVPGQSYEVNVIVATPTVEGLLAIDNATLAAPFSQGFAFQSDGGPAPTPAQPPTMHFCVDILPIFLNKCGANPACHASPSPGMPGQGSPIFGDGGGTFPAAGLVLDNSQGVADTAIGKVAHGSNTGSMAGTPSSPACPMSQFQTCPFGVNMPIIDPGQNGNGDPANSWMLYKMLLAVPPPTDDKLLAQCAPAATYETSSNPTMEITKAERSNLSNYILGREMPYPANPLVPEGEGGTGAAPLSMQELERVRLWIAQGAPLENVQIPGPDGGLIDGGTNCSLCLEIVEGGANPEGGDGGTDAPADSLGDAPHDATKG